MPKDWATSQITDTGKWRVRLAQGAVRLPLKHENAPVQQVNRVNVHLRWRHIWRG